MLPEGYQPIAIYSLPAVPDAHYCMVKIVEWTYRKMGAPTPTYYQHLSEESRNAEIVRRYLYLSGESSAQLAKEFGISDRRVRYIVQRAGKKWL